MAFRIHEGIVRGEIDNRGKGIVRGKIWVEGRDEPIRLELRGNAHPDLAGCFLTFTNPCQRIPHTHLDSLHLVQNGTVGDLTASRKVRVFDIPLNEALAMIRRKEKPSEHMANCLYLEWFSDDDGRVVIESTDYDLTISAPAWTLTSEENEQRARDAAAGMGRFMQKLTEAVERHKRGQKDPEEEWDEHDYEKLLRESDARTEKYMELLDKYGDSDEAEERIAQAMGWDSDDAWDDERMSVEEMNAICEEALHEPPPEPDPNREGIDWIRTNQGDLRHPVQHRCYESASKFMKNVEEIGVELTENPNVAEAVFEFMTTSVKLGGALNGIAEGRGFFDDAMTVAWLKRALGHLHRAQAGLEAVALERLLPEPLITETRNEMFAVREGIIRLMDELRGRL